MASSIFKPLEINRNKDQSWQHENLVQEILDEVILECSSLITDIENKKVNPEILKNEICKKVDANKGVFKPELVKQQIFSVIYGYGILEPYIEDEAYSDIDAPRYNFIMGKKKGCLEILPIEFESETIFERFCKLLVIRNGGVINAVDTHCRVSDQEKKLRINVCIPPRNLMGASLNIRKHTQESYSFKKLVSMKFLSLEALNLINDLNEKKDSFIICGKGASGKTTLLRSMINSASQEERFLVCESDAELYPQNQNTIVQQIIKNRDQKYSVSLDGLIREGLTMSLDTYCIGEITGSEAWPFIKAGHTDHRVMATLHASSASDALERLYMLVENETHMSEAHLKKIIARSIRKIIFLKQFQLVEIIEVLGINERTGDFSIRELYRRKENAFENVYS